MQQVASKSVGVRLELGASRSAQQACRPHRSAVVTAAHYHDRQLPQLTAAAAAAALLLSAVHPAVAAPGPTLFETNGKNVQELQDIIAARGKGLPELIEVPEAKEAIKAAKDVPLEKIQGVIRRTQDAIPDSVPNPLPAAKNILPDVKPQEIVQNAPQGIKQAVPSAPSLPSAPAAPVEGPSQTTILGAVAVVVAGGAAVAAAGKQGELPSSGDLQAGASQAADAAKDAAGKAASKAEFAAGKAPQSAEEAQEAAKQSASEAREWIKNWRNKQA